MCEHLHLNARAKLRARQDPTRTTMIRKRLLGHVYRRFRAIKGAVNRYAASRWQEGVKRDDIEFFMDFLRNQIEAQVFDRGPIRVNVTERDIPVWLGSGINEAYNRGLHRAVRELQQAGLPDQQEAEALAKKQAVEARRVAIQTRSFEDLRNVTTAMATSIRRELTDGIDAGDSPLVIARSINKRVDAIGIVRARTIARTEVIRAHHKATMAAYEEAEVSDIVIQAEFTTTGDEKVCPACAQLEGRVMELAQAEGLIPVHPNCRCVARPWLPKEATAEDNRQRREESAARMRRIRGA